MGRLSRHEMAYSLLSPIPKTLAQVIHRGKLQRPSVAPGWSSLSSRLTPEQGRYAQIRRGVMILDSEGSMIDSPFCNTV